MLLYIQSNILIAFDSCAEFLTYSNLLGFLGGSALKDPPGNAGDTVSTPGSGRSPGVGNGNPLQSSCLENSMDRGAWSTHQSIGLQSWTWLSDKTMTNLY